MAETFTTWLYICSYSCIIKTFQWYIRWITPLHGESWALSLRLANFVLQNISQTQILLKDNFSFCQFTVELHTPFLQMSSEILLPRSRCICTVSDPTSWTFQASSFSRHPDASCRKWMLPQKKQKLYWRWVESSCSFWNKSTCTWEWRPCSIANASCTQKWTKAGTKGLLTISFQSGKRDHASVCENMSKEQAAVWIIADNLRLWHKMIKSFPLALQPLHLKQKNKFTLYRFTQDTEADFYANLLMLLSMPYERCNWQQCVQIFACTICNLRVPLRPLCSWAVQVARIERIKYNHDADITP